MEKKKLRILITNDDGIGSEGLSILTSWARRRLDGFIAVVAPKTQQSGKSASINIHTSFEAKRVEYQDADVAWSVDSSPTDCVRFGFCKEGPFDLVLSGINNGYNIGHDIIYSGTCGAIFEVGICQINGVAFSTHFDSFDDARPNMDKVWDVFEEKGLLEKGLLWNVNFPYDPEGIRFCRQGDAYWLDTYASEDEHHFYATGEPCQDMYSPSADGRMDTVAVMRDHQISITPFDTKRVDERVLAPLLEKE